MHNEVWGCAEIFPIFRAILQDNCFIIQQILIDYHFQNEKNYGSMMKMLKASNA